MINWKEIGEEDYEANYEGFYLRLEAMGRNLWWFQVYDNEEPLWHEGNLVFTKEEAERLILNQINPNDNPQCQ
jgi:hypothetical protein